MNKTDLANKIAEKYELTKVGSKAIVDDIFDSIKDSVAKDEPVQIIGFGTFKSVKRGAKKARNPQTGETIKIPAKKAVKFVPGTAFKDQLNKKGRK